MKKIWFELQIKESALTCNSRTEFKKTFSAAYKQAIKLGILNEICSHMILKDPLNNLIRPIKWNPSTLQEEALKYNSRVAFENGSPGAYKAALRYKIIDKICQHMLSTRMPNGYWNLTTLRIEALRFNSRGEFEDNSSGAYDAALRLGIMDDICKHMKKSRTVSLQEKELHNIIQSFLPTAKSLRHANIHIDNKPHIKGFEIDIFVPEISKGIEFDGIYWHSLKALRKKKITWPDSDIVMYHQIKDDYFRSQGIEILHIKEENWIEDKDACVSKCLEFLGVTV